MKGVWLLVLLSSASAALALSLEAASAAPGDLLLREWQCLRGQVPRVKDVREYCAHVHLPRPAPSSQLSKGEQYARLRDRSLARSSAAHALPGQAFHVPALKASLQPGIPATWAGDCYAINTATLQLDGSGVTVGVEASGKLHDVCLDTYLLATNDEWYLMVMFEGGLHVQKLEGLSSEALDFVVQDGLQVFLIDAGIIGQLADIIETITLFYGPWTQEDSLSFLQESMNITYTPRAGSDSIAVSIDESAIPDGTFLTTQRFDGSEVMIQYGTGSYTGHTTCAIRINGSLHVCESNGKNQPDYWPPPYGVTCHPWKVWIGLAQQAGYMVSLVPLDAEHQKRFDTQKAVQFIQSNLGYPYGYHNFLFGWIDTANDNFPPPMSAAFFEVMFGILDHTQHDNIQSVFTEAMNFRLQSSCESVACIYDTVQAQGYSSLSQVWALPEQDSWRYSDGPSMVCDVFLLEVYKAAGVFGDLADHIQATEFTPRDLYTLAIFQADSRNATFGKWCNPSVAPVNDQPAEPVCQIMGAYVAQLPGWNTIKPYAHMAEKCPSLWPHYKRPAGC